jgi:acetyl esterase/lipase
VVNVLATWELPFETSADLTNAHWYNLALREGANYVNAAEGYKCNPMPTQEEVNSDAYQWAFQGDPYEGIIVYNRSDLTKTLSKVYSEEKQNDVAVLTDSIFRWRIVESDKGFLLATDGRYPYINEYGGSGGYLGFWGNITDVGSIFTVSEVGSLTVENVKLSTGATISIYKSEAEKANGRAVLVCPGGGYAYVAGSYEGSDWAPLLNDLGYTAAVLTYTTPPTAPDGPLNEAREAMKYLRDNAETYHVQTGQVGVMGFSAGGHLASTVATHTTGDEIPVFQILFYPVISMESSITHAGSRQNLLGNNPSKELITLYSNEKQVTAETPTAYLCWASNDGTVPPANSTRYITALNKAGVSNHKKVYASGGHGFGFNPSYEYHDQMIEDLTDWLVGVDDLLTSIQEMKNEKGKMKRDDSAVYNLSGQRVREPQHGIYITQGRKLLK